MNSFRSLRLRKVGFFALLCAQVVNLTAWGIQIGGSIKESRETTAKDVAISVPRVIAVCPHHPHGCPKDCMCPKTYITVGGDSDDVEALGTLNEPALVTCTKHGPQSLTPSFAVFLPEMQEKILVITTFVSWTPRETLRLPNFFEEPPQKIPIA